MRRASNLFSSKGKARLRKPALDGGGIWRQSRCP
jgi:hypothetical protein